MKKIIWVDDSISRMKGVVISLFPKLWEQKVSTSLVFIGDNYKNEGSWLSVENEVLVSLNNDLNAQYYIFCKRQYERLKKSQTNSTITLDKVYDDNGTLQPEEPINLNKDPPMNISEIVEEINKEANGFDSYVGLDIQLNMQDKILKDATKTMHLLYNLSALKVFLYATDNNENNNWKLDWFNKFKDKFKDFQLPSEKIFSREKLMNDKLKPNDERKELFEFLGILYDDGEKENE